jgi:hypothetical protein
MSGWMPVKGGESRRRLSMWRERVSAQFVWSRGPGRCVATTPGGHQRVMSADGRLRMTRMLRSRSVISMPGNARRTGRGRCATAESNPLIAATRAAWLDTTSSRLWACLWHRPGRSSMHVPRLRAPGAAQQVIPPLCAPGAALRVRRIEVRDRVKPYHGCGGIPGSTERARAPVHARTRPCAGSQAKPRGLRPCSARRRV